jgi:hypothetical protein
MDSPLYPQSSVISLSLKFVLFKVLTLTTTQKVGKVGEIIAYLYMKSEAQNKLVQNKEHPHTELSPVVIYAPLSKSLRIANLALLMQS